MTFQAVTCCIDYKGHSQLDIKEFIEIKAKREDDEQKLVPRTRTLSIATSSAQNDAGVFELNFRDERYMPFEGAGAIIIWNLELPNKLRQFDYDTISDLIMHISYTAKDDGAFREKVEEEIENSLIEYAESNNLISHLPSFSRT